MTKKKNNPLKASNPEAPPQKIVEMLIEHYRTGNFEAAKKLATSLSLEYPNHPFGWKALGAILQQTDKIEESLLPMQKSVELLPNDAEAHSNLGVTLLDLGKISEARASFMNALKLNPSFAEAYNNLGNTFLKLGKLDDAKENYKKAITFKPDYAEAHKNLGSVLKELGELGMAKSSYREAIKLKSSFAEAYHELSVTLRELGEIRDAFSASIKAINLKQNFIEAYVNLSLILKNISFKSSDPRLYPIFTNLLTFENQVRPEVLARPLSILLKQDQLIKDLIARGNVFESPEQLISSIESLNDLKILHDLMRICPLPDLELENLFVNIRRFLLFNLGKIKASDALIYFQCTLCLHCFTTEYIYYETKEETKRIIELEAMIRKMIMQSKQPELQYILCIASFRPLHKYDWCQDIRMPNKLDEIKKRLLEDPLAEKAIAKDIALLGAVSDDVSRKVRAQYEENPYPRWVKPILPKGQSISEFCYDKKLRLYSKNIENAITPKILIAGCGTGQHSIQTASQFYGCKVTAIDLSLASLAYAKRKTDEIKLNNLEYVQADILNLHHMKERFDIIESVGVLHHISEPMVGWRALKNLLKRGGLMRIGLYSQLARQHIEEIRKEIKLLSIGTSEAEMRNFRRIIIGSSKESHQQLTMSKDFFSLSDLRDLIFHVQEHRFTIPHIAHCLEELDLRFCGFGNQDIISNFRVFHGKDANIYDLNLWHKYEKSNPKTFIEMYQFWCQAL